MPDSTSNHAKLRIVLVGCGSISNSWFSALKGRSDVEIVGLADLNESAAAARSKEWGWTDARIGNDVAAMLKATLPDIVFDCTIPDARATVVETALRHGCHVLSEKPMASSMTDARRLIDAARAANRTFAIMQNRRYLRTIRTVRAFLETGAIGELTTLNSDFYIGAHFGGFRDQMRHVLLLDMAIHSFDQARFITGADPISVYCREWNPKGSWYAQDASAVAVFQMSDGLVHTYRGSWCSEGLSTSWECDWRGIGSKGSLSWDGGEKMRAQRPISDEGFTRPQEDLPFPTTAWPGAEGHAGCIHAFLDCLQTQTRPETDCTDNIKSLAMVFGAIESAESGREVTIVL